MFTIHWTMTTIITAASVASSVLVGAVLGVGKLLDVLRPQIRKLKATVDDLTSLVESLVAGQALPTIRSPCLFGVSAVQGLFLGDLRPVDEPWQRLGAPLDR